MQSGHGQAQSNRERRACRGGDRHTSRHGRCPRSVESSLSSCTKQYERTRHEPPRRAANAAPAAAVSVACRRHSSSKPCRRRRRRRGQRMQRSNKQSRDTDGQGTKRRHDRRRASRAGDSTVIGGVSDAHRRHSGRCLSPSNCLLHLHERGAAEATTRLHADETRDSKTAASPFRAAPKGSA
jgi:hypothetical protein